MNKRKKLQAKHIDAAKLLALVGRQEYTWVDGWFIAEALGLPWKVVNARLAALARQGIVEGCSCGCRGDWHLTDKGRALHPTAGLTGDEWARRSDERGARRATAETVT